MSRNATVWVTIAVLCGFGGLAGFQLGLNTDDPSPRGEEPRAKAWAPGVPKGKPGRGSGRPKLSPQEIADGMRSALENVDRRAFGALRDRIPDLNREELLEVLGRLQEMGNSKGRHEAMWPAFLRLAEIDPARALEEGMKLPRSHERSQFLSAALASWAKLNPEVALKEARAQAAQNPQGDRSLLGAVFSSWARDDFEIALGAIALIDDERELEIGIHALASVAGTEEGLRARLLEIASGFKDAAQGREFVERAVRSWAQNGSRDEVAAWVDAQDLESARHSVLLREVAEGASVRDPMRTAEWLMSRSTQESWAADLKTAVEPWAHAQPEACGRWLRTQLRGPESDAAVAAYSETLSRRDAGGALTWAKQIHDDEMRTQTLARVVGHMGPIPEERVREQLERAGLEEGLVTQLLEERE